MERSWLFAVLLSVSLHLGLIAAFGHGGRTLTQQGPRPVTMRLLKAPAALAKPSEPRVASRNGAQGVVTAGKAEIERHDDLAALVEPMPVEDLSIDPVVSVLETRYFRPEELTEKPFMLEDAAPNQVLVLPDIFPQPVILDLYINEQGTIDQVVMQESFLSEDAKRFVVDSFAKTRFNPGRMGDRPVKSRLTIEVRLEGALSSAH